MSPVVSPVVASAMLAVIASAGSACHTREFDLVDVKRDDLVVTVEVAGVLAAVDSTDVKPPVTPDAMSFKLNWMAPEGSEIAAGAPLVTFDSSDLDRNLESLNSQAEEWTTRQNQLREETGLARRSDALSILEQEASVQRATRQASVPPDLVPALTLRANQLDEQQAKAEFELAKKRAVYDQQSREAQIQGMLDSRANIARQIEQLTQSIARLTVTSPRAGTVIYATPSYSSDKRKIGDPVFSWDTVVQVAALGAMAGNGHVDEVDIARIAVHEPVTLKVEAFSDVRLHGTVASIATSVGPSDSDPSNIVKLQIAIDPTRACVLAPGMRFRGEIETQRIPSVIQVPAEAVFITPEGPVAYRATPGGLERVQLGLGHRSTETIEVTSGLSPGDRVSRTNPEQEAP